MKTIQLSFIFALAFLAFTPQHMEGSAAKQSECAEPINASETKVFAELSEIIDKGTIDALKARQQDLLKVINKYDYTDQTLLIKAIAKAAPVFIKYLKAQGAKAYYTQMSGPLTFAVTKIISTKAFPTQILDLLIDLYENDICLFDNQQALEIAAQKNHLLCVEKLLIQKSNLSKEMRKKLCKLGIDEALKAKIKQRKATSKEEKMLAQRQSNFNIEVKKLTLEATKEDPKGALSIVQGHVVSAANLQKKREEIIKNLAAEAARKKQELAAKEKSNQKLEIACKEKEKAQRDAEQLAAQRAATQLAEKRLSEHAIEEAARLEAIRTADEARLKAEKDALDKRDNDRNAAESELRRQKQAARIETQAQKEIDEELRKEQERAAAEAKRATKAALRNAAAPQPKAEKPKRDKPQRKEIESLTREQAKIKALQLAEQERQEIELKLKAARMKKTEETPPQALAKMVGSAAAAGQNNDQPELLHVDLNIIDDEDSLTLDNASATVPEVLPNPAFALATAQAAIKHKLLPRAVAFKQRLK